ncbi:uncharacterized protein KQ657_000531 [Scheffersomyces spartinae]|uniref:Enoyl reductase (ER) domain-containing protein n=1 Tax=Scheffersomyces spartinae TaxID=45513 RepID=A0A9P7V9K8_9ASCO|nr:uncharacterized protein KQ657_000531 [Scheffersomyces spartinae]KAG7193833.1 hypothetical protein KQ657_000531 [Scheffersomyces spartinae]
MSIAPLIEIRQIDTYHFTSPKLNEILISEIKKSLEYLAPFSLQTQKVVACTGFSRPLEVLSNYPIPQVGEHEVLVQNRAIGINPIDWKSKKYRFAIYDFPWINGRESSGVVVKTGSKVTEFKVGDKVMLGSTSYRDNRTSTFQEYTVMNANLLWKLPLHWNYDNGATIGVGLVTAAILLVDSFKIPLIENSQRGKTIIIWGGATTVGMYLTQLAKYVGLRVISLASKTNADYLISLGANKTISRHLTSEAIHVVLEQENTRIDFAVDCASNESASFLLEVLSQNQGNSAEPQLFTGIVAIPKVRPPSTVEIRGLTIKKFHEDQQFGREIVRATTSLFEDGSIQPVRHRSFKGGIDKVVSALTALEVEGASAEKYVVTLT